METTGVTLAEQAGARQSGTTDRLAELVIHLSDCPAPAALAAVTDAAGGTVPATEDERLEVVARALVSLRRHIDLRDHTPEA